MVLARKSPVLKLCRHCERGTACPAVAVRQVSVFGPANGRFIFYRHVTVKNMSG